MRYSINIKKINIVIAVLFLSLFGFFPLLTQADASPATAAGQTGITYSCGDGPTAGNCNFNDLVSATKKVVNFGVIFTLEFSVVVIAYAGFRYMVYGAIPGEREKANAMLRKVALGILFILAAWLIVTLITNALLKPNVLQVVPLGN